MARLLVVDDDPDALEFMSFHLSRLGHNVACASGGADALERAAYFRPEAVLVDLRMPVIDGARVLEILRGSDLTRKTAAILVSAGPMEEASRRVAGDPLARCMEKPLDFTELANTLAELLEAAGKD